MYNDRMFPYSITNIEEEVSRMSNQKFLILLNDFVAMANGRNIGVVHIVNGSPVFAPIESCYIPMQMDE